MVNRRTFWERKAFGDYVVTGLPNEEGNATAYWITKRGHTAAMYMFSLRFNENFSYMIRENGIEEYIRMYQERFEELKTSVYDIAKHIYQIQP